MTTKRYLKAIIAIDNQNAIGFENKLPWHCPEDLQEFRMRTLGSVVVMGRNTAQSFKGKPLRGRVNVIISASLFKENPDDYKDFVIYASLNEFYNDFNNGVFGDKEAYVIGGAQLYMSTVNIIDTFYVHSIDTTSQQADTYFNPSEQLKTFRLVDTIDFFGCHGLLKQIDIYRNNRCPL